MVPAAQNLAQHVLDGCRSHGEIHQGAWNPLIEHDLEMLRGCNRMQHFHVLVELKTLLAAHPKVHPDPARVRFVDLGAYSLDLEMFAYILTRDINEFLAIQEDLLLRIIDVVAASGTGFAFPSQTIYAGADAGLDGERSQTAEESVRKWREQNALGSPQFSPQQLARLQGTLE